MPPFTPLIINGQQVPSSTNATFDVRNSFSGKVVGQSASASSEDCKAAVEAAATAFKTWEHTTFEERRAIFLKAADIVSTSAFKDKVVQAVREETASTESWGVFNWAVAAGLLRTYADCVNQLVGQTLPSAVSGGKLETQRKAIGVVLAIAPWNAPFVLALRAVGIPLICGNTVVLKSSEYSPRTIALVVELLQEAGLPNGVLNFVSMSRETAPTLTAELIAHPLVRKINFTGSDRIGRIIAVEAAKHLKPCVLELGGKAPVIVLDDADIPQAAQAITWGSMLHSGQICMSTERVIVQKGVSAALISAVEDLCKTLKAGDGATGSTAKLSALFTEGSAENVLGLVREAVSSGAELLLGNLQREGAVVQPHLVKGVNPGMRLWHTETFGPVVVFAEVDTIDEAIDLANASDYDYSLTSSVWTSNIYSAQTVVARLRAGYININGATIHSEPLAGLRGIGGGSGYGNFDVENFTNLCVVVTHPLGREYRL